MLYGGWISCSKSALASILVYQIHSELLKFNFFLRLWLCDCKLLWFVDNITLYVNQILIENFYATGAEESEA